MGTHATKQENPENKSRKPVYEGLLKDFAQIVQVTSCPDLFSYRLTLRPILDKIIGNETHIVRLKVDRDQLFETAITFYKKSSKVHQQLMITFQSNQVDEIGLDGSGLRREFYSLFFKEALKLELFVGHGRRRIPSNSMDFVNTGTFEALGRAIVSSILNGDCGFPYLAPCVFYYLTGVEFISHLKVEDVPDPGIQSLIKEIMEVKDNDQLTRVIDSHPCAHAIDHIGWPTSRAITMNSRQMLVQQLLQWELIDKRKSSLDNLKKGLNHMGFLKATKGNPNLFPLLVYTAEYSISAKYVQTRLNKALDKLEAKDDQQNEAKMFFTECLKTVTDQEACWLYEFITGSLDPTLEEEDIQLEFNTFKRSQILPESRTCTTKLWIPLGNKTLPDFKKSFQTALENGRRGYGLD
ncbi:hypothetical protein CHS0354_005283 [Potamilus streckersoni]|uniref:HECT domain-containing protein n=1 Tax=Potamilus streckersoni TaxID=2493646 RepID=A0AAE0WAJ6_9BIVA|nr:hypothetical protein CHS0354_005283 [Potamilus streckersoni]